MGLGKLLLRNWPSECSVTFSFLIPSIFFFVLLHPSGMGMKFLLGVFSVK